MHNSLDKRLTIFLWFLALLPAMIIIKLVWLQFFQYDVYKEMANKQHFAYIPISAKRGEVFVRDDRSQELFPIASNITLDHMTIDPKFMIEQKDLDTFIQEIVPLIYEEKANRVREYIAEQESTLQYARQRGMEEKKKELIEQGILTESGTVTVSGQTIEDLLRVDLPQEDLWWEQQWKKRFELPLTEQISLYQQEVRNDILLKANSRYMSLMKALPIPLSGKIRDTITEKKLSVKWLVLTPENRRFYPENDLLSQVVGYVDKEGAGQYGLEGQYDFVLRGKDGSMFSEKDSLGRTVSLQDDSIVPAENGVSLVLTVDRAIQRRVEEVIETYTQHLDADFIDVVILEPKTGKIISLAQKPNYNPNMYTKVFETLPIQSVDWIRQQNRQFPWFKKADGTFYMYKNKFGPNAFVNHPVQDMYEPGSIMKPIVVAAAIEAGEITPDTTFNDTGPIELDGYKVHNHDDRYRGVVNMTKVLQDSLNTGMIFIAQKMGKRLLYNALREFGFGKRTDIDLDNESPGRLSSYTTWSDIQHANIAFGQGIATSPIQMAVAYAALANGGSIMRPYIIEQKKLANGNVETTEPKVLRQAVSPKTSETMKAMLTVVVEKEGGAYARVPWYYIGGKTGTAEIPNEFGRYTVGGVGTTIASFAGFGPIENPRFVIIVRVVRPRITQWGSEAAAPIFKEIASYLVDYYDIPPSRPIENKKHK